MHDTSTSNPTLARVCAARAPFRPPAALDSIAAAAPPMRSTTARIAACTAAFPPPAAAKPGFNAFAALDFAAPAIAVTIHCKRASLTEYGPKTPMLLSAAQMINSER